MPETINLSEFQDDKSVLKAKREQLKATLGLTHIEEVTLLVSISKSTYFRF